MSQTSPKDHIPGRSGYEPPGGSGAERQPGPLFPPAEISAEDFTASYGEELERTLNLDTQKRGENLDRMFPRLDEEINEAFEREDDLY